KVADGIVQIVHPHGNATAGEVIDLFFNGFLAVLGHPFQRELALAGNAHIGGAVLIAKGVAADHDRLRPARHEARNVAADDRLTEDGAAQNVANRAIGRLPHLLQLEFLDARLIWRDRRAFHADAIFLDRLGALDRYP